MSETPSKKGRSDIVSGILARFAQIAVVFLLQAAILFLAAGTLSWIWAWVFLGISVVSVLINIAFLSRNNLEMVAERGKPKEMKDWDKVISGLWGVIQYLLIPLVAGLDVRFAWTGEVSLAWHLAGALIFTAGLEFFSWAMITNAYFSTAARIQADRGQTVCRSGPYRFVRHPGYVGVILQSLGTPILLGSVWALIPAIATVVLMIIRTSLEDRMVQAELPGYSDFTHEVRYRLVPGIW